MNYDFEARADAIEALAPIAAGGFGVEVTLERLTGSTRSTATLTTTPTFATGQTGSGVQDRYRASEIDGTRIKRGDVRFYLSPVQTSGADVAEPSVGSRLTLRGAAYRVEDFEAVQPADELILYVLQLRGA